MRWRKHFTRSAQHVQAVTSRAKFKNIYSILRCILTKTALETPGPGMTVNLTHFWRKEGGFLFAIFSLEDFLQKKRSQTSSSNPRYLSREDFDHSLIWQNLSELVSCVMRIAAWWWLIGFNFAQMSRNLPRPGRSMMIASGFAKRQITLQKDFKKSRN